MLINTFSSNSLKILERSKEEFIDKYIENLFIYKKDSRAELGQKYHSLICAYIKGYDVSKIEKSIGKNELKNWQVLKEKIKDKKENFIKTEYSFLIKNELNNLPYYLTGRFDAVYKNKNEITIYDWKTSNFPKDIENDLQTITYLFSAGEIYKSENIKMKYLSIEKQTSIIVNYISREFYKKRIEKIISKIL